MKQASRRCTRAGRLALGFAGLALASATRAASPEAPAPQPPSQGQRVQMVLDDPELKKDPDIRNRAISDLLRRDMVEADALGFQGTPVFIIGPFVIAQTLDEAGFRQSVADARARRQADAEKGK